MTNDLQPEGRDYRRGLEIFAKLSALFGGLTVVVVSANAAIKKAGENLPQEEAEQDPDLVDLVEEAEVEAVAEE